MQRESLPASLEELACTWRLYYEDGLCGDVNLETKPLVAMNEVHVVCLAAWVGARKEEGAATLAARLA